MFYIVLFSISCLCVEPFMSSLKASIVHFIHNVEKSYPYLWVLLSNKIEYKSSLIFYLLKIHQMFQMFLSFSFFLPCCIVCGILVPQPGLEPTPLAVRVWSPRQLPNQMFHCKNHFADICYTFIEFLILCLAPGLKNTVQLCEAV